MGVKKDYSIVADSEMASSPRAFASSPAPIKRAPRTYGRRREEPDTSFTYSEHDSTDSIYKTAPPGMSDEVPPSEPSREYSDDGEKSDDNDDNDILPSFLAKRTTFGWKGKMKEIDEKEDLSEYLSTRDSNESISAQDTLSTTTTATHPNTDSPHESGPLGPFAEKLSEDISNSFFLSLTPPSQLIEYHGRPRRSSLSRALRNRTRAQKNIIVSDDDMNDDGNCDSRPSSPHSATPHTLATPRSQVTSSPPTSHHDVNSTSPSTSKERKKADRTRNSVSPLGSNTHQVESSGSLGKAAQPRNSLGQREKKKQKVKPPTKKELQETARERARLAAEQEVTIEKPATLERSIATFFQGLRKGQNREIDNRETGLAHEPGFLINQLSSPTAQPPGQIETTQHLTPRRDSPGKGNAGSTSKAKELRLAKLQLLQKQPGLMANDDDIDDLEIVPPTKLEQQRKSVEKKKMSSGQRMALANAGMKLKAPLPDLRKMKEEELEAYHTTVLKQGTNDPMAFNALQKQRAVQESLMITRRKEEVWKSHGGVVKGPETSESTEAVDYLIQKGIEAWSKPDRRQRVEEGDLDEVDEEDSDWDPDSEGATSRGRGRNDNEELDYEKMELGEEDEDSGNEEAEEAASDADQSDGENDHVPVIKAKSKHRTRGRVVDSEESDSGEYDIDDNLTVPNPKDNHYAVSSSDDRTEDENDKENDTRRMFDRSEDKENRAVTRHEVGTSHSVFDDITDRDLSLSPPHVLTTHDLESEDPDWSQSKASPNEKRKPFGVISDKSPLSLQGEPSTLTQAFIAQLKHSSPSRGLIEEGEGVDVFGSVPLTAPAASLDFIPVFGGGDKKPVAAAGFSQFSQDGSSSSIGLAPVLLQRGFSDLFDSGTQKDDDIGKDAQGLQRQESLGLTQDLVLQPAFRVDEKLLRKADVIFEKEQEYVVEAAGKKGAKEPELYVNEVGLLTQTKPSDAASRLGTRSPSFVLSPTQPRTQFNTPSVSGSFSQRLSSDHLTQTRPPLRTISLSNPQIPSSPELSPKRRRRLRRRGTPTPHESPISTRTPPTSNTVVASSPPGLLNLNDVLGKIPPKNGLKKRKGEEEFTRESLRNDWVNEEAEESDEDQLAGFGFIKRNLGEEEEEGAPGEDLDASLPELMDDKKMDEETEAVDLVMEKHQELMEKDDEEALKFHQGVVQGELRRKRKNRLGIDDSDDEDEEDERGRKIRRKIREKTERGDIQELAADRDTAAFANIYQSGLVDDDIIVTRPLDFDHDFKTEQELRREEDVVMEDAQDEEDQANGTGTGANTDDEDEDEDKYVTYKDIQAEARRMNERPEEVEIPDYEDVSWIDAQDGDEMSGDDLFKVQVVTTHKSKPTVSTTSTTAAIKPVVEWEKSILGGVQRRKENEKDVERSRAWAKAEAKNTIGLTGRLVGGIAVTGHGNKAKSGGGSLRSKGSSSQTSAASTASSGLSSVSVDGKKPLKAQSSVLAVMGKRRFE